MKALSGMDNLFLQMEQGNQFMHVASLGIYDQSTAPGGSVRFKQILKFFGDRIQKEKVFRRRLVVPPFNIDRPYWVEEGVIDVEYHVRHIALPAPGDWRQLMIQVARLHSRPLDRSKPLWEAYVIEGLDNIEGIAKGSFAFYMKTHHAAVDGEAGAQLVQKIHSLTNAVEEGPAPQHVVVADREPTKVELYSRAIASRGAQLFDAGKLLASLSSRATQAGMAMAASGKLFEVGQKLFERSMTPKPIGKSDLPDGLKHKPLTRFDVDVSPHRVVDAMGVSLEDCKTIREHVADVTINDIFIATCGGAVRSYLSAKGELPKQTLSALMPISTRGENKNADVGNQVGMVPVPLRTDIADPLKRLQGARKGARTSAGASSMLGHDFSAKLIQVMPGIASQNLITHGLVPLCNTTVSNVRGPNVPLYLAGAKLQVFLPLSIAFNGIGLNMTGFSYNGILWVCFVACRKMLPDPSFFVKCLNDSFAEILAAAKKLPRLDGGKATVKVAPTASAKAKPAAKKPAVTAKPKTGPKSVPKPALKPAAKASAKPAKVASKIKPVVKTVAKSAAKTRSPKPTK